MDGNGDENAHLFAVDIDAAEPIARDLTPLEGVRGGSYGGYAALSGAAFTPDVFVAAVDRVGISDMVSLIEDWRRFWRVGDELLVAILR